jgi:hypothetical protein
MTDWYSIKPHGFFVDTEPTWKQADELGAALGAIDRENPIVIGDFLNYVREHFGDKYSQMLSHFSPSKFHTIENYVSITHRVPPENRPEGELFISYLDAVAALPPEKQKPTLQEYLETGGRREGLRQIQRQERGITKADPTEFEIKLKAIRDLLKDLLAIAPPKARAAILLADSTLQNWEPKSFTRGKLTEKNCKDQHEAMRKTDLVYCPVCREAL